MKNFIYSLFTVLSLFCYAHSAEHTVAAIEMSNGNGTLVAENFRSFEKFKFVKDLDFFEVEKFARDFQNQFLDRKRKSNLEQYVAHKLAYESYQLYDRSLKKSIWDSSKFSNIENEQIMLLIYAASIFKFFQTAIYFKNDQEVRSVQRSLYHDLNKTTEHTRYLLKTKNGNCDFGASAFNYLFRYGVKLYENSKLITQNASSFKITGQNHRFNYHAWNILRIGSESYLLDLTYPMFNKNSHSWEYFLADPKMFIMSHFPQNNGKHLQGLTKPLTYDEFNQTD